MIRGEIFQIAYLMAIVQFVKRHSLASLRWMVPVFRFFEYVNFERKEQKVNSTS